MNRLRGQSNIVVQHIDASEFLRGAFNERFDRPGIRGIVVNGTSLRTQRVGELLGGLDVEIADGDLGALGEIGAWRRPHRSRLRPPQ